MPKKKSTNRDSPTKSLRQRAEETLQTSPTDIALMPTADLQLLVHELQVHQIELEIQNEELRQAQIELSESRDLYSDLYEYAPAGYLTLDQHGKIVQANLRAARLLEIDRQDLVGAKFPDFVDREGQDEWHFHRQAVFAGAEKQTCELPLCTAQRQSLWGRLESEATPAETAGGVQCRTVLLDVTQRKRAEEELLQLHRELEDRVDERTALLKLLSDMATMANRATSVEEAIRYCLQRVCNHNGWKFGCAWLPENDDPDQLIAGYACYEDAPQRFDRLREQIGKNRVHRGQGLIGRVFACGEPELTTEVSLHLPVDAAPLAEHLGVQNVGAFPILVGNTAVGVLEFFSDKPIERSETLLNMMADVGTLLGRVVERQRAQMSLRKSEERLRAILHAAPDAVVSVDSMGAMTDVNPAAERIFGYSADEMLGQNISLLMPSPYREEHDSYIVRYLETREPNIIGFSREVRAQRKDGRIFPIELAVNEIGHMELFIGVIRDISKRKELEKQVVDATANEQRRIGQDIHDGVGQELTGLRYMAQTHAESLNKQGSPDADTAQRMTDWLETVQHQLRAIIRELVPVEVDQQGLVAALRGLAERTSEVHDLNCVLECAEPILVPDAALGTHLYRIVQEAVRNAVRHSEADRVVIQISEDEDTLKLQVTDDGVGIRLSPNEDKGIGIRSMEYRASLIGAALHVRRREEGGTQVTCMVLRGGDDDGWRMPQEDDIKG